MFDFLHRSRPKPPPLKAKTRPFHVGGGLKKPTESELAAHVPQLEMKYYDPATSKVMDERQVASARQSGILKPIFYNPMQDYDYLVIEALCKTTIIGPAMNILTQFIVGTGFRPELELIDPSEDSKSDQAELKKHHYVIKDLKAVERAIDAANDISFREYIGMLIDCTNTFNRAAIILDDATKFKGIPTTLKFAHPRDLSITTFTESWRLESVLWRHHTGETIPRDSMIYLWNPLVSAKYRNSWQYGGSMILPMIDAAKTLRKIIAVDFPAMAEATWAGMFILGVRPQGQTETDKSEEYGRISQNMVRGGPNILLENPEDLVFHTVDFKPEVNEFRDLTHFLIKYCIACTGMPASMFFDESDSNRSAARSKIQLATNTIINPTRERLGRQICRQSYQKWFEKLHPGLIDKVRIKLAWDDLRISEWFDRIEAALEVDSRHELTDEAFSKLAEIPNYSNLIKPDKETHAGGQGEKPHNIQRDNTGKNLDVGISKNKEGLE